MYCCWCILCSTELLSGRVGRLIMRIEQRQLGTGAPSDYSLTVKPARRDNQLNTCPNILYSISPTTGHSHDDGEPASRQPRPPATEISRKSGISTTTRQRSANERQAYRRTDVNYDVITTSSPRQRSAAFNEVCYHLSFGGMKRSVHRLLRQMYRGKQFTRNHVAIMF